MDLLIDYVVTLPVMPINTFRMVLDYWYAEEYLKLDKNKHPLWHMEKTSTNASLYIPKLIDKLNDYHLNEVYEYTKMPFDSFINQNPNIMEAILIWCRNKTLAKASIKPPPTGQSTAP